MSAFVRSKCTPMRESFRPKELFNAIMAEVLQDLELWEKLHSSDDLNEIVHLKKQQSPEFEEYISAKLLRRCQGSHS